MQILCCTDCQHGNAVMMFLMYLLSVGEHVIYCRRFSTITVLLLQYMFIADLLTYPSIVIDQCQSLQWLLERFYSSTRIKKY